MINTQFHPRKVKHIFLIITYTKITFIHARGGNNNEEKKEEKGQGEGRRRRRKHGIGGERNRDAEEEEITEAKEKSVVVRSQCGQRGKSELEGCRS